MREEILDLEKSIIGEKLKEKDNYWEILGEIKEYIEEFGSRLDQDNYYVLKEGVFVSKDAIVSDEALIEGPCIIGPFSQIKPYAYIRENVIIGSDCVVGHGCEIKNSIMFNESKIAHFNYVGDSILGYRTHLGAGAIISNLRFDKKNIEIKDKDKKIEISFKKMGVILGDNSEVGCNTVILPGSYIGKNTWIYPLLRVGGYIPSGRIVKDKNVIVERVGN